MIAQHVCKADEWFQIESSRPLSTPKQNKDESTDMIISVLQFLDASPNYLLDGISTPNPKLDFFSPFLDCGLSPNGSVRQHAIGVAKRLFMKSTDFFQTVDGQSRFGEGALRKRLWSRR